ncbi:hypothetical protein [Mycetocola spongiae]|uniref:hypothetical protein n=1 Tax=Mycetocola spongiae TaxID=2859226 RepID=UPI001CF4B95E|nr:hypothetical protein [Mycetocola spongiae]UCR89250.1 hypothetical protein KXZ72_00610 [Mycetocola spongiae]
MPHTVTFRPVLGEGADGPVLGDPVTVRAYVEQGSAVVIKLTDGKEITSTGFVIIDPGLAPAPESILETSQGAARVIKNEIFDHPDAPSHIKIRII